MAADMVKILSRRIKQARDISGFSMRALAEATKGVVSHSAIAKYERGDMCPGSEALTSLAVALDQPLDFFIRPFHESLTDIRFRRRISKLAESKKNQLVGNAKDFFERYWEIERILEVTHPFDNPVPQKVVTKPEQVAGLAEILREEWGLGSNPLPNVHQLMEFHGIKVHELSTDDKAFDGFSAISENGPVVVIASWLNEDIPRKRMTEVHELAHILLNIPKEIEEKEEEKIVWEFTGQLLMPKEELTDWFGKRSRISLAELIELKENLGVSIMAIVYRANKLGLLSKQATTSFFKYANREGWRSKGEPGKDVYKGSESSTRFETLVHRAVIEEKITEAKAAALLKRPLSELRASLKGVTFS